MLDRYVRIFVNIFSELYHSNHKNITNTGTAMCGVAAGATKAKISQHFARNDNLADLVAKEGTWC